MSKNDLFVLGVAIVGGFIGFFIRRLKNRSTKAGSGFNSNPASSFSKSSKDDDYEPYSGK
ncbi:MAG: hypothetical protein ABSG89_01635 [Bacteroidales bacterium]|jgi:hypothetical protein